MEIKSCAFNIDTGCVELAYADGTVLAIDCTEVENSFNTTARERAEMDWLIYNDPYSYVELVLRGELEDYLKQVAGPYSDTEWFNS